MYCPKRFAQQDTEALHALVAAYPLGMLVTHDAGAPDADHLPFEWLAHGEHGVLHAHVARGNPLWKRDGQQVLAVFRGPSAYFTPDRVRKMENGGREVPTWLYQVVHLHGRLRAIDDAAWLRALVERQTGHHEAAVADPWSVGDAPPDYAAAMLKAIVGIEIVVERVEAKWKTEPARRDAPDVVST